MPSISPAAVATAGPVTLRPASRDCSAQAAPSCRLPRAQGIMRLRIVFNSHPHAPSPAAPVAVGVRRRFLIESCVGIASAWALLLPGFAATMPPRMDEDELLDGPRFRVLNTGVRIQDLVPGGQGPAAGPGSLVLFDYVLRRTNGYFVYSTIEGIGFQPRDVPTEAYLHTMGNGLLIPGLEEVLTGMKAGGKRRAIIPASSGYAANVDLGPQPPPWAARRQIAVHAKEPLVFELVVRKVSNPA